MIPEPMMRPSDSEPLGGSPSETPTLPEGRHVELPGRGVTFVRHNPGPAGAPTLVLLHGWTATADLNFCHLYDHLAQSWRVVALDHRGHGRGLRGHSPFRLEDCADDAVALLDVLGISEAAMLGYSMGGPIALLAWARHPARVRGLVLCATSSVFVEHPWEALLHRLLVALTTATQAAPGHVRERLIAWICNARVNGFPARSWLLDELSLHHWPTVLEAGCVLGRFRADPWVGRVDIPTAVVAMLEDQLLPTARQLGLARRIPGATLHTVDAGHDACLSAPQSLIPALVAACDSVRARLRVPPSSQPERVA